MSAMPHAATRPSVAPATAALVGAPVEVLPPPVDASRLAEPASWPIAPDLTLLNHGSYGSVPRVVADAQAELRRRIELDPVRFFKHDQERYLDAARAPLAAFVNAPVEDVAFVPNATFAVATAMHAVPLGPGDEVVVTDHEYAATMNELDRICAQTGATKVVARVPFPHITPEQVEDAVMGAVTERTKLVIVSHIASASAVIFPVERIVPRVKARDIEIIVDGAHAPGQTPVDIAALAPTFYAASTHKWLCTPKGTGFLYADPSVQHRVKPLALSCRVHAPRAERKAFLCDFDYTGTSDTTGNMTAGVAIAHLRAQLPGGWDELRRRNHALVRAGAQIVCERLGLDQPVPGAMTGSMMGIALPTPPGGVPKGEVYDDRLWDRLVSAHRIQVPAWEIPGVHQRVMRISAQLHNSLDQYQRLADALAEELARERSM